MPVAATNVQPIVFAELVGVLITIGVAKCFAYAESVQFAEQFAKQLAELESITQSLRKSESVLW